MQRVALLALVGIVVGGGFAGVAAAGEGPMADAGLDQTVTVGTTVQLDGTGSRHPSGAVTAHEWTIRAPDGEEVAPDCETCERSRFTPRRPGRYEVTLAVADDDGRRATDTLYVYVEDAGPSVELAGPRAPSPEAPATYRAVVEGTDAELATVAWAVDDEIVAVRSLDGTTDESELTVAFSATEPYRVQAVVRDANGRTAYDQVLVRPREGAGGSPPDWSDAGRDAGTPPTPPGDPGGGTCSDVGPVAPGCIPGGATDGRPGEIADPDDGTAGPLDVVYRTAGYEATRFAGTDARNSEYVGGLTRRQAGLDGGRNAPWNRGLLERGYEASVGRASRLLFGQERRTVTCRVGGDEAVPSRCAEKVAELETEGRTSNVRTDGSGVYSEYGLRDARRVSGEDPTDLEAGRTAEVTVIVQEEQEGLVDEAGRTVRSSATWIRTTTAAALREDDSGDGESATEGSRGGADDSGDGGPSADTHGGYEAPDELHSSTVVSRTGLPRDLDGEEV